MCIRDSAYSDNIYYSSETAEANAYLLGGATPSTSQTTQYLLRNEALKQLGELADELRYQIRQRETGPETETEVMAEYLQKTLAAFEEYLALVPPGQQALARTAVEGAAKR